MWSLPSVQHRSPCLCSIQQVMQQCICWLLLLRLACQMYWPRLLFYSSGIDLSDDLSVSGIFQSRQPSRFRVLHSRRESLSQHLPTARGFVALQFSLSQNRLGLLPSPLWPMERKHQLSFDRLTRERLVATWHHMVWLVA